MQSYVRANSGLKHVERQTHTLMFPINSQGLEGDYDEEDEVERVHITARGHVISSAFPNIRTSRCPSNMLSQSRTASYRDLLTNQLNPILA
jgi:hypothetical protein